MSAKHIKINTNRLKSDADTVNNHMKTMKDKISTMEGLVTTLGTMWEGDAKAAFMSTFKTDIKLAKECMKEIKALYDYEAYARETYDKCEQQVMSLIDNIKV